MGGEKQFWAPGLPPAKSGPGSPVGLVVERSLVRLSAGALSSQL